MTELVYQVSFTGAASSVLLAAFDDCQQTLGDATTTLHCEHDALQDVLGRLESFNLELLDVRLVAAEALSEGLPHLVRDGNPRMQRKPRIRSDRYRFGPRPQ